MTEIVNVEWWECESEGVSVQGKRGLTELGEINCQQCLLYKYVQQR